MSLDRVTLITFLLAYAYGITTILTTEITTTWIAILAILKLIALTTVYVGVTWFLIWLDHTYYPHLQNENEGSA